MADTKITNLQQVKDWLLTLNTGQVVVVSSELFDAQMVNLLFGMLPGGAIEVTVTEIVATGDSPSLTGTSVFLEVPDTQTIFTFTEPETKLLLTLNLNMPENYTWGLITAFNIGFTKLKGTLSPNVELETISLGFACDVIAGSPQPIHLPVEMSVPSFNGDWTLSGSFSDFGNLTYDILYALSGNNEITSILPEQIAAQIAKFQIKEFELSFNPSQQTVAFIRIVLQYTADWHFFGNLFVVENIQFEYEVFKPFTADNYYQATLLANMNLFEGFPFQVGGQFPDKVVFSQLQPDRPAELTKVFNFLQIELPEGFPDIEISTLSLVYYTADGGYNFKLAITKPIPIAGTVSLDNASFEIGADYDAAQDKMIGFGSLFAHFTIDKTIVLLSADYREGEGVNMVGEVQNLPIGQLIASLLTTFGITDYPKFIEGITIVSLKVTYQTKTGNFTFDCIGHIPMADNPGVDIEISLTCIKSATANGYDSKVEAKGVVKYQQQVYTLVFTKENTATSFSAKWENQGTPLGINDIANMLGMGDDVPTIPPDLDLALDGAVFVYNKAEEQPLFMLGAHSANYGGADFVAIKDKQTKKWIFYFGMATDSVINLSNLPIIDKIVSLIPQAQLAVEAIHVDIASSPISKETAKTINDIINKYPLEGKVLPNVPEAGMSSLVSFSMQVNIGGTKIPISLSAGGSEESLKALPPSTRETFDAVNELAVRENRYSVVQTTNADNGGMRTFWFNLQKNFGPLYFEKIGLAYDSKTSKIYVLVNVAATAGGLTIALNGFGVSLPIKDFNVSFTISGISVTFQSGPILISGGLMGTFTPVNLVGQVYIKTSAITIGALGGYTEVDGRPSLFIYAVLNYPIGGPPYLFVKGLSAGFGFNRSLVLPGIDGVDTFPFVQWAMGFSPPSANPNGDIAKQINETMQRLLDGGVVAPVAGSNWLTAGIRFTSFEILDSFAMLSIAFGTNFEIALLGLSRLILPPGAGLTGGPLVIVYAELALKASFSTATGLIAVQGQLTNNSYVLSRDCRLTGGFAFYVWVSGEHLGEFVVTLGGYNPNYQVPDYYPVVPRLGMNWKVTNNFTIKGGMYFALTSNAVMVGGYLDAVWQSGGIKAWFSVQADFLIMWKPFYYDIRAGVSIGASFSINLLFTTLRITIHVGASLHIWGPEFTGEATVDLDIISFTIRFGAANQNKQKTITWTEFARDMLPQKTTAPKVQRGLLHEPAAAKEPDPDVVKINIAEGLIMQLSDKEGELNWIVNGQTFQLTTNATIPSKTWEFAGQLSIADDQEALAEIQNTDFGIRPTGNTPTSLASKHKLTITSDESSHFRAEMTLGKVAKALWEPVPFDRNGNPVVGNPVADTTLNNVLTGFSIVPHVEPPKHTLPIKLENLQYEVDENYQYWHWSDPYVPTNDDFGPVTVEETINSTLAVNNRNLLVAAINTNNLNVNPNINVNVLADPATNYLLAEPVMRLLGEEKQA